MEVSVLISHTAVAVSISRQQDRASYVQADFDYEKLHWAGAGQLGINVETLTER